MPDITSFFYDGHGHSIYSDGTNTPEAVVAAAVKKGLKVIGLSDHNSTAGWSEFLAAGEKMNANGTPILLIPSVEVSTQQGDLLVLLPDPVQAKKFAASYDPGHVKQDLLALIEKYVHEFQAYFVFLHPEAEFIHGIRFEEIEKVVHAVDSETRAHLGIELHNWMSHLFRNRSQKESSLAEKNKEWKLAEFAFTDFHAARDVGNGRTQMEMRALTPNEFMRVFRERKTLPQAVTDSPKAFVQGAWSTVFATFQAYFGGNMVKLSEPT